MKCNAEDCGAPFNGRTIYPIWSTGVERPSWYCEAHWPADVPFERDEVADIIERANLSGELSSSHVP